MRTTGTSCYNVNDTVGVLHALLLQLQCYGFVVQPPTRGMVGTGGGGMVGTTDSESYACTFGCRDASSAFQQHFRDLVDCRYVCLPSPPPPPVHSVVDKTRPIGAMKCMVAHMYHTNDHVELPNIAAYAYQDVHV